MNDYTVIYLILCILAILGITYLSKYLRERNIISQQDLEFAVTMLGITSQVINELHLKDEKNIRIITNIVLLTIEYVKQSMIDIDNDAAFDYAKSLCTQFNIELTKEREIIIKQLLNMSLLKLQK